MEFVYQVGFKEFPVSSIFLVDDGANLEKGGGGGAAGTEVLVHVKQSQGWVSVVLLVEGHSVS